MDTFQKNILDFIAAISEKAEFYSVHMKYPEELRKLFPTNAALCVNSMIEKARSKFRWILSAACVLEVNIYLQEENLRYAKWKNGVPSIRKCINHPCLAKHNH